MIVLMAAIAVDGADVRAAVVVIADAADAGDGMVAAEVEAAIVVDAAGPAAEGIRLLSGFARIKKGHDESRGLSSYGSCHQRLKPEIILRRVAFRIKGKSRSKATDRSVRPT
jgi:hypothetical protein